jgi:hypothetical protein
MKQRFFWKKVTAYLFFNLIFSGLFLGGFSPQSAEIAKVSPRIESPQSAGNLLLNDKVIDEISLGTPNNFPLQGVINSSSHRIFWFLQISDTQMVWSKWGQNERRPLTDGRVIKLRTFFNTTQKVIAPLFIVNTGDLVDSAYESFLYRTEGQKVMEWEYYNETMHEMGMNSSYYFDMVGNHDIYRDPGYTYFLKYSVSGAAFQTDQYMMTADLGFGKYSFYTLSTPEDNGLEFPFGLGGMMSKSELDWFENKAQEKGKDSSRSFAFGHQPIGELFSEKSSQGNNLLNIFKEQKIDMYLFGHGHVNKFEQYGEMVAYETAKIDEGEGTYRIVAVDENGISTTEQIGTQWPAGIITAPLDTRNTRTEADLQYNADNTKIRALAWDPLSIKSVEWRADEKGGWLPMTHVEGPLYEGEFLSSLKDGAQHQIEIRITNVEGKTTIKTITYCSKLVNHLKFADFMYWLIGGFIGICSILSALVVYRRKANSAKFAKKPESVVDKDQAKRVLLKLLVLLCMPLTFGLIYAERITALFAFFLVGHTGILYSDVVLIAFAGVGSWIPLQALCLSPKNRKGMKILTGFSIFFEALLWFFFITHYPTVAWFSPGYYGLLYLDRKIWTHSSKQKL